jgi:hypothetical protein
VPYLRAWNASGRGPQARHLGEPLGVYVVEVGALNTLVYLWQYDDAADRARGRRPVRGRGVRGVPAIRSRADGRPAHRDPHPPVTMTDGSENP